MLLPIMIASLTATGLLSAQDAEPLPRAKALGEVRSASGKPWVAAEVWLVSPAHEYKLVGPKDLVTAKTDARGRFRAEVLTGRVYTAWAQSSQEDGRMRLSALATDVVAGIPLLLQEKAPPQAQCKVEIRGLAAYQDRKPLRLGMVQMGIRGSYQAVELDFEEKGDSLQGTLPTLPGGYGELGLYDRDGMVLLSHSLRATTRTGKVLHLRVDAPVQLGLAVRDIETGKGIPGARLFLRHQDEMLPVAKAGPDGFVRFKQSPAVFPRHAASMFVAADGYQMAPCRGGAGKEGGKVRPQLRPGASEDFHANLKKGSSAKGRVLLAPETPAKGLLLVLQEHAIHWENPNSTYGDSYPLTMQTDKDGRFHIEGLFANARYEKMISVLLRPEHVALLPRAWRGKVLHHVPLVLRSITAEGTVCQELADIDLSAYCPLSFEVVRPSGAPVPAAVVEIMPERGIMVTPILHGRADNQGRVGMLLPPSGSYGVTVKKGGAWYVVRVFVGSVHEPGTLLPIRLPLPEPLEISGQVLNKNGRPVSGLTLTHSFQARQKGKAEEAIELPDAFFKEAGEDSGVELRPAKPEYAGRLLTWAVMKHDSTTTDEDGRFKFLVPAYSGHYTLRGKRKLLFLEQRVEKTVEVEDHSLTGLELRVEN